MLINEILQTVILSTVWDQEVFIDEVLLEFMESHSKHVVTRAPCQHLDASHDVVHERVLDVGGDIALLVLQSDVQQVDETLDGAPLYKAREEDQRWEF